ncbi:unnamed protein product [Hydatigera taeniaeformis]|uniref:Dentin sialophosphoprotein-like n=1 Tax=Hydatigena taeniaeformis TaxID=6205 RepID=A0A0R3X5T8_HYDTA|nr:unnamed protein product [Hydatigera taeniaeformis]
MKTSTCAHVTARQSKKLEAYKPKQCCAYSKDPVVNKIVLKLINQYEEYGAWRQKSRKVAILAGIPPSTSLTRGSYYKPRQTFRDPPADVLNLHANFFTEPKDFCPRTLRSSASSRIRELACYNPPRRRQVGEHLEKSDSGEFRGVSLGNAYQSQVPGLSRKGASQNFVPSPSYIPNQKEQQLKAIRHIAVKLEVPADLMLEFLIHPNHNPVEFDTTKKAELNSSVSTNGTKAPNDKNSDTDSQKNEDSLSSPSTPSQDSCRTTITSQSRQFDCSSRKIGDESDVGSESDDATISLASLSPSDCQSSQQRSSKLTSEIDTSSGLSGGLPAIDSEIEETSRSLSSFDIKRTVKSDKKSKDNSGNDEEEEGTDIDESCTIESFDDDE